MCELAEHGTYMRHVRCSLMSSYTQRLVSFSYKHYYALSMVRHMPPMTVSCVCLRFVYNFRVALFCLWIECPVLESDYILSCYIPGLWLTGCYIAMFRRLCAAIAAADMVRTYKTVYITVTIYIYLSIYIYPPTDRLCDTYTATTTPQPAQV